MIVRREKYFIKEWYKKDSYDSHYRRQKRKRTSYWLLGIIPLFITTEVIDGDYEWGAKWLLMI